MWKVPKQVTAERVRFWREVRNQEIDVSRSLSLETLGSLAEVETVMMELGYSPILKTIEIDPGI